MKRCPSCDRTFEDEALSFCPHDGAGLVRDTPSAPVELQATMMATPSSRGGASYPPPPDPSGPGSGSFNQPPPNQSWQNQQTPPNPSRATPSASQTSAPRKSSGVNKKVVIGVVGCLGLAVIVGIVGVVLLYAFSGPSSKMNPYKGDLKELVPEKVGDYTRGDVDVLGERGKKNFLKVNDALGVAYKGSSDTEIRMFVGNYSSSKDAEDGLKSFKDERVSDGWSASEIGSKKLGWRTVGVRYILTKDISTGKADEKALPDGAVIVLAQASTTTESKKLQFVGWTNGSVIHVVAADGTNAVDFEKLFDAAVK